MAGLGFRRFAQTLAKGKGSSLSALVSGCRAASGTSTKNVLGPHPKSLDEQAAAANKYNLTASDYKSFPDNGEGFGDYPNLPERSQQERDPWYQWDHPDLRRNWGEPIPWDFDMYIRNRVDTSPSPVSWSSMCKQLFGFIGFMLFMFYVGEKYKCYQPVGSIRTPFLYKVGTITCVNYIRGLLVPVKGPKQYPYNNLYLERGGDPEKQPEEIKHYEI